MRSVRISLIAVVMAFALRAPAAPLPEAGIRSILNEQVAAWNRGDLEGYMAGYWKSPELTFFGGSGVTRGWQPTLARYRQRYQGQGKEMGSLTFGEVSVELLGSTAALVRGEWRLRMSDGKETHGLFSVIFRQLPEGWRIVHDHSS